MLYFAGITSHLGRKILLVGFFALSSVLPAQEMLDSKGKDFWIAFAKNSSGGTPSLFISSETATSGTVSIPGLGYSSNFTTTPGTITTVVLSTSHCLTVSEGIEDKGIHITAVKEVTVYGLSRLSTSTDAFLCLPTDVLGNSYIIPSYQGGNRAQLVVVGTQNGTDVTITPTADAQSRTAGVPFTITLDKGEAFQLQASSGDLTGSSIVSTVPVAVYGSNQCTNIPVHCCCCDFIVEQIPPVATWGKSFIAAPLASRNGDIYRFLASANNTAVTVNGTVVATLNQGEFYEALYTTGLFVTSDKAISVIQYSRSEACDGTPGDPFMMLIPPYEQFLGNYIISTSDSGFPDNYINLVVPTNAIGDVKVDGAIVPTSGFTAIGTSGFHYAAIPISIGTHTINSNHPVGVHVYGFGSYDSYGYPGGQSFSQIAYIDSIVLAPPASSAQTGTQSCVQATVLDNNDSKVPGVRVDFYVSGVNTASGFAFTDSNGVAEYCYTGVSVGKDSIYAITGSLTSNTVYKIWTLPAIDPVADAGPDLNLPADAACNTGVTLDGSGSADPDGGSIVTYRWSGSFAGAPISGPSPTASITLASGIFEIILTVTDDEGSTDTDTVMISINDVTAPTVTPRADTSSIIAATQTGGMVALIPATATDNCTATPAVTMRRADALAATAPYPEGTTIVWWKACDDNGNCDSATQRVLVTRNNVPVIEGITDTIIDEGDHLRIRVTAQDPDGTIPALGARGLPAGAQFVDSGNGVGVFTWTAGCRSNGSYVVTLTADDGIDRDSTTFEITVNDINFAPRFISINDTTHPENTVLSLLVRAEDCDGTTPEIRAVSIPSGATFQANNNGTGTLLWTPDCDDNGYYILIFETSDGTTTVRDTILVRITDVNCYDPVLTLSATDTTTGIHLPITVVAHTTDNDGTTSTLEATGLPEGAAFADNGNGNGIFTWTPGDTGSFIVTITAIDGTDPSARISSTLNLHVVARNFTGPVFLPVSDTIIDENQNLAFTVTAHDSDGTIPQISRVTLPGGAALSDNGDGSAGISWTPGCTMSGGHWFVLCASDGEFTDTLKVLVDVREHNCAPEINPITDKNIDAGGTVRFTVSATDPDRDIVPALSVATDLVNYTFSLSDNGSGVFEWRASASSGSYQVTFYANDGFLTDTESVRISVGKAGTLHIIAKPEGAGIYACPGSGLPGAFLGTDTATVVRGPGTYWYSVAASGYRTTEVTGMVKENAVCTLSVKLKPRIPLMVSTSDTARFGSEDTESSLEGSIAFVDFDADGIDDLSVARGSTLRIFKGENVESGVKFRVPAVAIKVPSSLDSITSHTYADWNNDGKYECILSLRGGCIRRSRFDNEDLVTAETLLTRSGEILFPLVYDADGDRKKDMLVIAKGKGAYFYRNTGIDAVPSFDSPRSIETGNDTAVAKGAAPVLYRDLDGDGRSDLVAGSGGCLKFFAGIDNEKPYIVTAGKDFNIGGARVATEGNQVALMKVSGEFPRIAVLRERRLLVHRLRLVGDVTGDGVVNISDISRIAKAWELTEKDDEWDPQLNLWLSGEDEDETIDIKDISKTSKNWELEE